MTHSLRPYQLDAEHQVNTLLNAGRHPLLVMPTGTGKTKTACAIIRDRIAQGRRVFVLVPQEEIFGQWVLELSGAGLNPGTIDQRGVLGRDRHVYVCMPLSLANLLPQIPEAIYPDEIITDEAHHSAADTWESLYAFWPRALRLGLTATPRRTDGKGLGHLYTDIVQTITMAEAIAAGYLAKPLCIVPEQYLERVEIRGGDYDVQEQAAQLGKTQIIGDVIRSYGDIFAGLPVLVACSTFEHAAQMTAAYNEAGWRFAHIHSHLPSADRRRMLREIRTGKLNGLCTVGIGIEGMDIPGLYGLIWLRRTLSLTIYLQFIGRVLRPAKGKTHGIILDPVGNLFIHGFPEAAREWTLDGADRGAQDPDGLDDPLPPMRICPYCGVANAAANAECHFCGGALLGADGSPIGRVRHLPAMVDGNLVAVTSDGQAQAIHERSESIRKGQAREDAEATRADADAVGVGPIVMPRDARGGYLREGLFSKRRPLFDEAVKNFLK